MNPLSFVFPLLSLPLVSCFAGTVVSDQKTVAPVETTASPLEWKISTTSDYTSSSHFEGKNLGDLDTLHNEVKFGVAIPLGNHLYAGIAGFYDRFDFGTSTAPVPDRLEGLGADLSLEYRFKGETAAGIRLSPGFYGDNLNSNSFTVPVVIGGSYYLTPHFILGLGVSYNEFREYPWLPVIGFRWIFNDQWKINALLPELNVVWTPNARIAWDIGARLVGGSFKTDSNAAQYPNARVDYYDLRFGTGVKIKDLGKLDLYLNAGWSFQRRFRYDDSDTEFKTKGAPYVGLEGTVRF